MASTEGAEQPHPPEAPQEGMKVKPHCACLTCDTWINSADWCPPTALHFECKNKKTPQKRELKPLMRSEKHPGGVPKIQTYNPKGLTRLERQAVFKTLVHGEIIPDPVHKCTDTYFSEGLQTSLKKLNYRYSRPIQSFAWPAIFRMMNVAVIGGPRSGKTLSYLPAVCTFTSTFEERYACLGKYKGPCVVIVCPNSQQCEEVFDLIGVIYADIRVRPKVTIVTYPVPNIHNTDILITIPGSLLRCLKARIVNFKRLCHLVFEDASTLLRNNESGIHKILELVDETLEHRAASTAVQLIATAEKWTSDLGKLLKSTYNTPLVCIEDHLEAALYGNINFEIKFLMSSQKLDFLECLLVNKFYDFKTVVICDESEIVEVNKGLVRKGIRTLALSSKSNKDEIEQYELEWNFTDSGCHKVLVCTDLVFDSLLCINSAMWLINFSYPSNWTRFTKRFSLLSAHYKSPLDANNDKKRCKSFVLIDETCEEEMSRILHLLGRLTKDMPSTYQQYAEGFRDKVEKEKIAKRVHLCPSLKLSGKCPDLLCKKRHLVSPETDVSEKLPKSGKVEFRILHITDVTRYSVFLTGDVDDDFRKPLDYGGNVRKRPEQIELGRAYAHRENTVKGEIYMLCHVLRSNPEDSNKVEVRLFSGLCMQTMQNRLFELPPNLKIVDVYLSNLVPPFKDAFFSRKSHETVRVSLQNLDYKRVIFTGRVDLQLDNTLWLNEVVQMSTVDGTDVIRFNLFTHLKKLEVVEACTGQISALHKLCKKCDIDLPVVRRNVRKSAKITEVAPQAAFLDDNYLEVILSCAYSPDEFYVRLAKFQPLLENLQKDIATAVNNDLLDRNAKIEIGKYYLAPDRQGETYARAKVIDVQQDKVLCFHVDYGDESVVDVSTLKILPSRLLTRLPFQAIQCRLFGLAPMFGEWDDDATDILYRYMFEPESDIFRSLYVETRSRDDGDTPRAKVKYAVSLKDGYGERQILINQLLLDCGLATSMFEKIDDFEIPQAPVVEESSEEEVDVRRPGVDEEEDAECVEPIDLEIRDMDEFLQMFCGMNAKELCTAATAIAEAEKEVDEKCAEEEAKPAVEKYVGKPAEKSPFLTPEVYWSQTDETIRLKVKLVGVDKYKTNIVLKKIFTFRATVDEKPYYLKLTFHGRATLDRHRAHGQEVVIVLNKVDGGEWPQLTNTAKRMRNIHYEISENEPEAPKRKFLQLDITDDESSGDDGIMYVETSDQDSEYDCDQPNSDSDEDF